MPTNNFQYKVVRIKLCSKTSNLLRIIMVLKREKIKVMNLNPQISKVLIKTKMTPYKINLMIKIKILRINSNSLVLKPHRILLKIRIRIKTLKITKNNHLSKIITIKVPKIKANKIIINQVKPKINLTMNNKIKILLILRINSPNKQITI